MRESIRLEGAKEESDVENSGQGKCNSPGIIDLLGEWGWNPGVLF